MKILITGGAGFIGSTIVRACLEANHQVVVLDNLSRGKRENLPEEVPLYVVDIRDARQLQEIFEREQPEIVSHHAALASVRESAQLPELYWNVNVHGTANVIRALTPSVRKLIFASSGGAIYGSAANLPLNEDSPTRPISPYGESKLQAERLLLENALPPTVILRYGNVYGPGQDPLGNNGVISIFARAFFCGERPVLFGDGSQIRDYIFVKDVARANLLALADVHGIFNIASGKGFGLLQIYRMIANEINPNVEPEFKPSFAFEVKANVLDISRARKILGWEPQVYFERGLRLTLEAIAVQIQPSAPILHV